MSYTLHIVSKSVLDPLDSVKKCLIDSLSVLFEVEALCIPAKAVRDMLAAPEVAEAPWSEAEWAVAPRFDNPRATVLVLVLG